MLNYGPHGRRRLGRPSKRLLDEAATGLLRPNSLHDSGGDDDDWAFHVL